LKLDGGQTPVTTFEPRFAATAIGSLPHKDVGEACRLMLDSLPEIPGWPQLSKRTFLENMYAQYSEGLPGIRVDEEAERVWFQVGDELDSELEGFYQAVIEEDLEHFAISPRYAAGLAEFTGGVFAAELSGRPFIKGHVTGPISFGLTVTDQNKKSSLYNEVLEEAIVKGLALKAMWQCDVLRKAAPGSQVLLCIDEPYLVSVGSALVSVEREQVVKDIGELVERSPADVIGVHCCGNTDWSLIFETGMDMVSFDAFGYLEEFVAYDKDIARHLENGGTIAWGIVPNTEKALEVSAEELVAMLEAGLESLEGRGVDRDLLARRSLVTPSCGLGPTTVEIAERALPLTGQISAMMREKYFGDEG
jgi:methionine synthase II (cobalamin-independent)